MDIILEIFVEVLGGLIYEGIVTLVYWIFNKFFKAKLPEKTARKISVILTTLLFLGAIAIVVVFAIKHPLPA